MPPRWESSLEDFVDVAAYLLGADRAAIAALPRLPLAESALHAPFASVGGVEAYPTLVEQAAAPLGHLVMNHPLPDANKRAAFLLTARFLETNGLAWDRRTCRPMRASSSVSRPARPATRRSLPGSATARTRPGDEARFIPRTGGESP